MILRIIVNVILSISVYTQLFNQNYLLKESEYGLVIILLSINLILYIAYNIKSKNEKILLLNIIYLIILSCIWPLFLMNLFYIITEYISEKEYNVLYLVIGVYILIFINIGISYENLFIGIVSFIFMSESINFNHRINELKDNNYNLKESNYKLEQIIKRNNKMNLQNIETIKMEERNILSQNLHDKIGHTLAGNIMQLEALKIILKSNEEKGFEMLDNIIINLRDGMDDIRQTLRKVKPDKSKISINNLKSIIDEFSRKSNIDVELKVKGDLEDINIVYWKAIVDSCNEILTNTIKYTNGNKVYIEISVLNKIIRFHVKDNGIYRGSIQKGMGLIGIEERVINLNGNVVFDNEDGFSNLIIFKR